MQDWGPSKYDPVHALASWASIRAPTLTRWQLYAATGQYDRYDPAADLLRAAKEAGAARGTAKYDMLGGLFAAVRASSPGTAAPAPALVPTPVAGSSGSVVPAGGGDKYDQLLERLLAAAAAPGIQVRGGRQWWALQLLLCSCRHDGRGDAPQPGPITPHCLYPCS